MYIIYKQLLQYFQISAAELNVTKDLSNGRNLIHYKDTFFPQTRKTSYFESSLKTLLKRLEKCQQSTCGR